MEEVRFSVVVRPTEGTIDELQVWCDPAIWSQISLIPGVVDVDSFISSPIYVYIDPRQDINRISDQIMMLADENVVWKEL